MERKWTIMVYMAGDNNLAEEMIGALQDIKAAERHEAFTAVARFDSGGPLREFAIGKDTKQDGGLKLTNVDFPKKTIKVIKDGYEIEKEVTLRRIRPLVADFIVDTILKYPADNYMLVLSGHGSGAVGDFLASSRRRSSLSVADLESILKEVHDEFHTPQGAHYDKKDDYKKKKIDILGMDSCLMSMAEVAYEVRQHVEYLVGAEGFEPNTGWPYGRLLLGLLELVRESENLKEKSKEVAKKSEEAAKQLNEAASRLLSSENLAREIVSVYVRNYQDYKYADVSTDQSARHLP